jgi:hypothetical protein
VEYVEFVEVSLARPVYPSKAAWQEQSMIFWDFIVGVATILSGTCCGATSTLIVVVKISTLDR